MLCDFSSRDPIRPPVLSPVLQLGGVQVAEGGVEDGAVGAVGSLSQRNILEKDTLLTSKRCKDVQNTCRDFSSLILQETAKPDCLTREPGDCLVFPCQGEKLEERRPRQGQASEGGLRN